MQRAKAKLQFSRPLVLAVAAIAISPLASPAILVVPHALFIDHRDRTAQFTLANPSEHTEEVEIDLKYGYPASDSLGRPYIKLFDAPDADAPSAADWIRAFPQRLRLEPGQRQLVRLLASPPPDLPDREYWSRIIVTSRRANTMATEASSGVAAGLTLELRTIIALLYRKGSVRTGVQLNRLHGSVDGDSLRVSFDLRREGNAAYLGALHLRIEEENGRVVRKWKTAVAVYQSLHRRLSFPLEDLEPGRYRVRFELSTAREDVPQSDVLPAPTIERTFQISVN